ncbi:hypothetical protein EJV47_00830 [Hymenobacter gummosus]|uniref:Uncharacterized protein n=1 Tax=Hymenobacter gummosus TaxID=1776032 RepID=A0A3S0HR90_9BACT|nr:hypothetical protein [Hymenobacter gummosus]RTQ53315.1 hypothetical protein EJV47_00830 [Hymenobacter gummosus]
MRFSFPRFSGVSWLLAGVLLLSLALNAYYLLPGRPQGRALTWQLDDNDFFAEEDEDDDDDQPLGPSRAALADELRRARLQLDRCRATHTASRPPAPARRTPAHPHG